MEELAKAAVEASRPVHVVVVVMVIVRIVHSGREDFEE
jgi:hypothetical protein